MAQHGARGLEIAPGLAFPQEDDAFAPSPAAVRAFNSALSAHGVVLVSMQSLLFGVKDALLFGGQTEQANFLCGLERAIALANRLGIPNLVMGSPKNRVIPDELNHAAAEEIAIGSFRMLGEKARKAGVKIALEPNPAAYGTNFLNTLSETAAFAQRVDHPGVTVNFDIGALIMNEDYEQAGALYESAKRHVSHVHVSEPQLAPAPADAAAFARAATALKAAGYDGWFSIEMRRDNVQGVDAIDNALAICARALSGESP